MLVIIVAVILSIFVGVLLGLLSGYFGGWLDRVLVVICDAIYAFPSLLLAIVMAIVISGGQSSLWGGILAAAISITVVFIPQYFRVIRAEAVRIKAEAFVESAKVIGAEHRRIMFRHVLRNSTRTLPLIFTLNASEAILTLAGLGFLGFGIEPTAAAEWGYDLNKSLADVTSGIWWTVAVPGPRDRARRARHHPGRREPQRPGRPAAARTPPRGSPRPPAWSPRPRSSPAARSSAGPGGIDGLERRRIIRRTRNRGAGHERRRATSTTWRSPSPPTPAP